MSVRPVDLQMMVPKSAEVTKTTSDDFRRPEVFQEQFTQHLQKQVESERQQVNNPNQAEKNGVYKDGTNGEHYEGSKKRRERDKEKPIVKQKSNSMFDVTI